MTGTAWQHGARRRDWSFTLLRPLGVARLLALASVLSAHAVGAPARARAQEQPQEATVTEAPDSAACETLELRLDGASAAYDQPDTHFREQWRPALQAIAGCLDRGKHARSCLEVQGHYDERTFEPAVTRALGSRRAAQLYRARARAGAVLTELHDLGVSRGRLQQRPPPAQATYRGASVTLVPSCLPEPAAPLPAWASSPEAVADELEQRGLLSGPAPPPPAPTIIEVTRADGPSPVWLETGTNLGGMLVSPDGFALGGVTTGLGWSNGTLYLRGQLGVSYGSVAEQRTAFEYALSGGYRGLRWLDVGVVAGHRIASKAALDPWLAQSWRLGIESAQRIHEMDDWSLWIGEALSPVGGRVGRAVVVDGRVFEIPERRNYALRFDISVFLRGRIF